MSNRIPLNPCADRRGLRHDAGVAIFATGLRTPFARYWLSGFLADFGDGVQLAGAPPLAVVVAVLAWRHRKTAGGPA